MLAVATPPDTAPPRDEQRMVLHTSWKEYVILRELLDSPGVRMTYLQGALELMSPSPAHELWKTNIARLIELYAYVRGIDLRGYGSTTFKKEATERGAEPDECYLLDKTLAVYPEMVLEVIYTVPLVDKLSIYAEMGVTEVWTFRDGSFRIHGLDGTRYLIRDRSAFLPELDFAVVAKYARRTDTLQALREFEAEIRTTAR